LLEEKKSLKNTSKFDRYWTS